MHSFLFKHCKKVFAYYVTLHLLDKRGFMHIQTYDVLDYTVRSAADIMKQSAYVLPYLFIAYFTTLGRCACQLISSLIMEHPKKHGQPPSRF